jgi:hypothetical protein
MLMKIVFSAAIGGVCGYLWYRMVGCSSGACPLTSKPLITIIYGAAMGILVATAR